jgi:hypothetical protein
MILDAMLDHRAAFLLGVTVVLGVAAGIVWLWRRARGRSGPTDRK